MPENPYTNPTASHTNLAGYTPGDFKPGASKLTQVAWYLVSLLLVESGWLPIASAKRWLLKRFGAAIGRGVVIKPHVRIKFPWRLEIGDHTWIGEGVWIDNLAEVRIGSHACVSQGAYLCTGSHDAHSPGFELQIKPITVGDGAWVAACSILLPGVTVAANGMAAAGSLVTRDVGPGVIVGGNPAKPIGVREPGSPEARSPGAAPLLG